MIKKLSSQVLYQNKWMELREDQIQFEDGSTGMYGYMYRVDGVGAVVLNHQNQVLLVRQFRYPIGQSQWNIPGGGINLGENLEDAVRREVFEETGIQLHELEKLGEVYPMSSGSTEKGYLYLARVNDTEIPATANHDADESFQEIRFIPLAEALAMIDSGEIDDAATANAVQMVARRVR